MTTPKVERGNPGPRHKGHGGYPNDPVPATSSPSREQVIAYLRWMAPIAGVPVPVALAVSQFESGFNHVGDFNSAGYNGPMQTNNKNAVGYGWKGGDVESAANWKMNIQAGLMELVAHYTHHNNWHDAYAAYNGGEGAWQGSKEQHNADTVISSAKNDYNWDGYNGSPRLLYQAIGDSGKVAPGYDATKGGSYTGGSVSGSGVGAAGGGDLASVLAAALAPSTASKRSYKDYLGYLYNKGLDPTPEAINFAHFAAQHQLSTSEFDAELYQQGWFKDEFPGIFNSKGGLIMSPRAYTDQYRSFAGLATSYGFPLSKQQFGYMVKNNQLDSTMFQDKLYAVHTVEANRQTMRAFENVLRSKGLVKGKLSDEELYKFVMRQAPPDWYKVWDEGAAVTGAVNAGIHFGADITRAQVANLIQHNPDFDYMARTPGGIRAEQAKWYKVAQDLKTIAPPSRLYQDHGLKASDLAELEFGGPRAADVYDKAQRALAAYKSSSMPEAHAGLSTVENRVGSAAQDQLKGIQAGVPR